MNESEIIQAVKTRRAEQDEKHPVMFRDLLHPTQDPTVKMVEIAAGYAKADNDSLERAGEQSAYGVAREELYEFFAETDPGKQTDEAIDNIAVWVRILEALTRR